MDPHGRPLVFVLTPGVETQLPKWCANDGAMAKADAAVLRFTQLAIMTPLQYGEAHFSKAFCVIDFYNKGMLKETLIGEVDESIRHFLRGYWTSHLQADILTWHFIHNFLWPSNVAQINATRCQKFQTCRYTDDGKHQVDFIDSDTLSTRRCSRWHRNRSRTSPLMTFDNKPAYSANALQTLSSLSTLPTSVKPCKYLCQGLNHKSTLYSPIPASNRANIAIQKADSSTRPSPTPSTQRSP